MSSLSVWLSKNLSELLDFSVPEEMIQYVMGIESNKDLEDYLKTLLDFENPKHKKFLSEFLAKRSDGNLKEYMKPDYQSAELPALRRDKKKKKGKPVTEKVQVIQDPPNEPQVKKKNKFVNLYSQEGQAKDIILLKGRHKCNCQASKHKLINNCIKCGRIVCEQEGSGPCFFCNNLVCSREEQQILNTNTKYANKLYQKLLDNKPDWNAALEHRDRLLEYDRTSERRTRVIDDESDYFASNSVWLSKNEREKLKKKEEELRAKRHASRLNKKITFDFAGHKVIEADDSGEFCEVDDEEDYTDNISSSFCEIDHRLGILEVFPENVDSPIRVESSNRAEDNWHKSNEKHYPRVQDRELMEMSDDGYCLSLHQPWATLLVAGIKMHEGRTWYTPHRGRLWIAATVRVPPPQEIREVEDVYRTIRGDCITFPSQFPSGCLLGFVNVVDCLPQEEYIARFPEGECTSPYVFICEDSHELPVRFPIQGKHKIYKLDSKIHQAAQKSIQRISKLKANKK